MRVYVAGPLFTPDERQRMVRVAEAVEAVGEDPVLPWDEAEGFTLEEDRAAVYQGCVDEVRSADAVVAVLDGVDVDSGVAYEVGFARARGTPVLGIRTDYRGLGPEGRVNTMLQQGVSVFATPGSPDEEADAIADFLDDPPAKTGPRLARDKVPQMRARGGDNVAVDQVAGEDHARHLKRYLVRRAEDLLGAEEVEEKDLLTDLLEGVETLIAHRGWSGETLRRVKEERQEEFGGLDDGVVVETRPKEEPR